MPAPGHDWAWCPRCRAALGRTRRGGHDRPTCAACGFVFFANPGIGAAVVVRDGDGRVLLVRRARGQWGAGAWCIPCGFVEWGEDVRAAAVRETREETGLEVTLGDVVQVASNFHDPASPTVGIWFAGAAVDPAATPVAGDDADAVGWFDPAAPPLLAFPTDAALLARPSADGQRGRAVIATSAPTAAASAVVRKRPKGRRRAR